MNKTTVTLVCIFSLLTTAVFAQMGGAGVEGTPSKTILKKYREMNRKDLGINQFSRREKGGKEFRAAREALSEGNLAEYIRLLQAGAELGHSSCTFYLAEILRDGIGVKRDLKKSYDYYESLAARGFPQALYMVGLFCENGWGTEKDYTRARISYEKSIKIDKHYHRSWRALGSIFFAGKGVEKDYEKAYSCFEKAASKDNPRALFNIAFMKEKGMGTRQDLTSAIEYYHRAAIAGDIKSLHTLARHYENGSGVERDKKKALEYYTKAAEAGYFESFFYMGKLHLSGEAGKVDYATALQCFARAAQKGHLDSYCEIGLIYEKGLGLAADMKMAAKWYGVAADEGNERGQYLLGLLYLKGDGVPLSKTQGEALLRLAAEQGYPPAIEYFEKGDL